MPEIAHSTAGADQRAQYLTFELGPETYAMPLLKVQEIREYSPATRLPDVPEYVVGVMSLRGVIIPVIDLRARLGFEPLADGIQPIIIVVSVRDSTCGLRADSVSDVVELSSGNLQPPPPLTGNGAARYVDALAQMSDRSIILLDLDRVLGLSQGDREAA